MQEFLERMDLSCSSCTRHVKQVQDILQQSDQQYEQDRLMPILQQIEEQARWLKSKLDEMVRRETERTNAFLANENLYAELAS